MNASTPIASLSLDLDNEWSYLKTHGDPAHAAMPTYLPVVVPRLLAFLAERSLSITCFVVGHDAQAGAGPELVGAIAAAGHEVGNHSWAHEPWLHTRPRPEVADEITRAEDAIARAAGTVPRGFRGPGYSLGPSILSVLAERHYAYDASSLPTWIGPFARRVYLRSTDLDAAQRHERRELFGHGRDALRPLRPYRWRVGPDQLLTELPVTVMPGLRTPVHCSYLLALAQHSARGADAYFAAALRACRLAGVGPSILLHPLDFLDHTDVPSLAFFPALRMPAARKAELLDGWLGRLARECSVGPLATHVASLEPTALPVADAGRLRPRRGR